MYLVQGISGGLFVYLHLGVQLNKTKFLLFRDLHSSCGRWTVSTQYVVLLMVVSALEQIKPGRVGSAGTTVQCE